MCAWPLVKVEGKAEDLAVQKTCDVDSLLHQDGHYALEQVATDVIILVLTNVLNNIPHSSNLVIT